MEIKFQAPQAIAVIKFTRRFPHGGERDEVARRHLAAHHQQPSVVPDAQHRRVAQSRRRRDERRLDSCLPQPERQARVLRRPLGRVGVADGVGVAADLEALRAEGPHDALVREALLRDGARARQRRLRLLGEPLHDAHGEERRADQERHHRRREAGQAPRRQEQERERHERGDRRPEREAYRLRRRRLELLRVAREAAQEIACVEIKILRRVRAESSRSLPRHRRDACSIAWRCRFLAARPSQDGSVIAEK